MSLGDLVLGVAEQVAAEVGEVVVVFVEVGLALVEVDGEVGALPKAVVGEVTAVGGAGGAAGGDERGRKLPALPVQRAVVLAAPAFALGRTASNTV